MSIAATLAGGLKAQFGTDTKPIHAGLAAKFAVTAAQLAAAGVTADPGALDEPQGFINIMNKAPSPGFAAPLAALGQPLAIDRHGILTKAYPSCSYTHRPIDAMLNLRPQIKDVSAIERMCIKVPDAFFTVAGKRKPQPPPEARFSITWCIAAAAIET